MPPVAGWPTWQRVNFIVMVFGSGLVGLWITEKLERRHEAQLEAVIIPGLKEELAGLEQRKAELEGKLEAARSGGK